MSKTFYTSLLRTGQVNGRDAIPDDYDTARTEAIRVYAWAVQHGLDRVAALADGMLVALKVIDPRNPEPPY